MFTIILEDKEGLGVSHVANRDISSMSVPKNSSVVVLMFGVKSATAIRTQLMIVRKRAQTTEDVTNSLRPYQ